MKNLLKRGLYAIVALGILLISTNTIWSAASTDPRASVLRSEVSEKFWSIFPVILIKETESTEGGEEFARLQVLYPHNKQKQKKVALISVKQGTTDFSDLVSTTSNLPQFFIHLVQEKIKANMGDFLEGPTPASLGIFQMFALLLHKAEEKNKDLRQLRPEFERSKRQQRKSTYKRTESITAVGGPLKHLEAALEDADTIVLEGASLFQRFLGLHAAFPCTPTEIVCVEPKAPPDTTFFTTLLWIEHPNMNKREGWGRQRASGIKQSSLLVGDATAKEGQPMFRTAEDAYAFLEKEMNSPSFRDADSKSKNLKLLLKQAGFVLTILFENLKKIKPLGDNLQARVDKLKSQEEAEDVTPEEQEEVAGAIEQLIEALPIEEEANEVQVEEQEVDKVQIDDEQAVEADAGESEDSSDLYWVPLVVGGVGLSAAAAAIVHSQTKAKTEDIPDEAQAVEKVENESQGSRFSRAGSRSMREKE